LIDPITHNSEQIITASFLSNSLRMRMKSSKSQVKVKAVYLKVNFIIKATKVIRISLVLKTSEKLQIIVKLCMDKRLQASRLLNTRD